ncbi:MAG: glutamate--tRNA ligase family protein [Bacteroidaceae bacterium]|nr:glutamate--tRNA ligase family protein [Bacteroidaceae bacterium]
MTRGRFAPSPTGRMHLGNVFCALLSWLSAKSKGGEWVLRIEDLDPQRSRREYALQLMDDLQWLGLPWDGEPVWQSQRGDIYEEYLQRLTDMGLTYPCYCTRADIMATQAPHETDGRVVYKGTCRPKDVISDAENDVADTARVPTATNLISPSIEGGVGVGLATTRLIVPDCTMPFTDGHYGKHDINLAEHCGDYIIRRKDGAWAYQLAVVVDDALMGVTEIVRGRDLLLSSPQQIHLRNLLFQSTENRVQSTEYR